MSSEVIIGRRGEAKLRLGRCSRCGLSPLPRRSLGCPWVPATSSAATWTCPTADHPKGKDSRLYRPVRPIPQTHKGKLPPSLTVDFRVRLAAAALRTRTAPGLPAWRRRRPRPRLPRAATRPAERRRRSRGALGPADLYACSHGCLVAEGRRRRTRTLQLQRNRTRRPGNVQRLAKLLDNRALRVHIQPQYPLGGAVQAPTNATHAGQLLVRLSIREQRGDLAAPPGPGGFVRLPAWLSRR